MLAAGYLSGWGEGASGVMRATAELECTAAGEDCCIFVRTSPAKLESTVRIQRPLLITFANVLCRYGNL